MEYWRDKVVVVSGGSTGLGLEIAKALHRRHAKITVLARNNERLQTVVDAMNLERSASADGFSIDMTGDDSGKIAVERILSKQARIDVWVNAVGQSIRSDLMRAGLADYRRLMDQNFFASVGGSLAAIPALADSGGHLVNIGSLAAKTAWPFLAPYVASKHALAGFAHQLRLEAPANIHCLFVCPGPIAANDSANRYRRQTINLPDAAAKPGAGAPTKAIDAHSLAEAIVRACEKRRPELIVPRRARLLFSIAQLFPSVGDRLLRRFFN